MNPNGALRLNKNRWIAFLLAVGVAGTLPAADGVDSVKAAQSLGARRGPVSVQPDGLYVCEAEEFRGPASEAGWRAKPFGENYYAATFANSFLSRRAFLGAPAQCDKSISSIDVQVRDAGRYLVLVRYEAAYRFETQFRVQVEQNNRIVLDRLYGARNNLKIWAFGQKLKKEVGWSWGAVENVVWEGHDAFANLKPGRATIRLIASNQPEPAAKRNVDLVMLTTDVEQVKTRIEKERYLPLDGMLTQSGDVWLRVTNRGREKLTFKGRKAPGGGNWQQHSPYWVHTRNWTTPIIEVDGGGASKWVEVGGTMDSLNHGQWFWTGNQPYKAEFGWKDERGKIQRLAEFVGNGDLTLAADCDTRYSKRLRQQHDVLYDLLKDLKDSNPSPHGRVPKHTPIYASTFTPLDKGRHSAAVMEFKKMFGLSNKGADAAGGRGIIDVRSVATAKLDAYCKNLGADAKNVAVVSLGDEIRLPSPSGAKTAEAFRTWLKKLGKRPADIDPAAGGKWDRVVFSVDDKLKVQKPGVFYWSRRFRYQHGIEAIKQRTDILRRNLPNAAVGANFSPHYPQEHMFLGEVYKWVTVFRRSGMTLPWSEDYIWQVAVGTPQMNNINLDLFRAGLRHHPDRKTMYYVMPHMPNNTPRQWRRLFYGALAHGMKMVNLFEFRPVHVAYTENHVDEPEMYRMVLGSFRELGLFDDIVQNGRVADGETALWFSETGDIWGDSKGSFAAAKRALYTAIRHQQVPLDFVVEEDAMDGTLDKYKVLYLTDAHVSAAASKAIGRWVAAGGELFATAGAGMFDEYNKPNTTLRKLMGAEQVSLDVPDEKQIIWLKQHMPFTKPLDHVSIVDAGETPVIGVRCRLRVTTGQVAGTFSDKSPAIVRRDVGKGRSTVCGFLPSLSYYYRAFPLAPVDRGASDDAMVHFLPTAFDKAATGLIGSATSDLKLPVKCSMPMVETTVIRSKQGVVVPLINWSRNESKCVVEIFADVPRGKVSLASGAPVELKRVDGATTVSFDLGVADALIFRNK